MKAPDSRFTIANIMILVALVALVLGVVTTPGLVPAALGFVILVVFLCVCALILFRMVLDRIWGLLCPNCGRRGLERRALVSFGERYYLCPACGIRCRRSLAAEVAGPLVGEWFWEDASGPGYDALYQKAASDDPWDVPPGLEDEEDNLIYSKTHGNLIRNKRQRRPENPNGPGLE